MPAAASTAEDVIVWGVVLIAAVLILGAGAWQVRRRLFSSSPPSDTEVWSLQQLRDMRSEGRITEEEYEVLRTQVLEASGLSDKRKDGASPECPGHPGGTGPDVNEIKPVVNDSR